MDTQIQFKLMKKEKKIIKETASEIGLAISPFIRMIVLKHIKNLNKGDTQ